MVTVLSVVSDGIQRFYWKRALLLACCCVGSLVWRHGGSVPKNFSPLQKVSGSRQYGTKEFIIFLFVQEGCMETTSLESRISNSNNNLGPLDHWSLIWFILFFVCFLLSAAFSLSLLKKTRKWSVIPSIEETLWFIYFLFYTHIEKLEIFFPTLQCPMVLNNKFTRERNHQTKILIQMMMMRAWCRMQYTYVFLLTCSSIGLISLLLIPHAQISESPASSIQRVVASKI